MMRNFYYHLSDDLNADGFTRNFKNTVIGASFLTINMYIKVLNYYLKTDFIEINENWYLMTE